MHTQATEGTSTEDTADIVVNQIHVDRQVGNRPSNWRKLLRITLVGILVAMGGSYLAYKLQIDLQKWRSMFSDAKPYFVICHWILIVCSWIYWSDLVTWGLQKRIVRPDEEVEMRSGSVRIKLFGFLVAFELLIVMQVQNVIYAALTGH